MRLIGCSIEGCAQPHRARGLCGRHYTAAHRNQGGFDPVPLAAHGSLARYAKGCRCESCRAASASYARQRRATRPNPRRLVPVPDLTPDEKQQIQGRIEAKVVVTDAGCWEWLGTRSKSGYASISIFGVSRRAHRVLYEIVVGAIPDGLQLDHLCRVRHCVNPVHLEPVTPRENVLRGVGPSAQAAAREECIHGHAYTPENTYVWRGHRACRECRRLTLRRRYARRRAA